MKHYNYIFAGAGLSSLMTVYEMVMSKKFEAKTILLLDFEPKKPMIELGVFGKNQIMSLKK